MSNLESKFIESDPDLNQYEQLQTTIYNAVNTIAVLEKLVEDPPDGGEHITFDLEQYTGLQTILAGAKAALNHVADMVIDMEPKHRQLENLDSVAQLEHFESECSELSEAECIQELRGYEYFVGSTGPDDYLVSHLWSLRGLRNAVAHERLYCALIERQLLAREWDEGLQPPQAG